MKQIVLVVIGLAAALAMLTARHVPAWVLGDVQPADDVDGPRAVLSGDHPRF